MEKLFSPDLFIMGGGISKKADKFIPYLTTKTEVIVVPALMRNEAGIIGAAYLAQLAASGPARSRRSRGSPRRRVLSNCLYASTLGSIFRESFARQREQ